MLGLLLYFDYCPASSNGSEEIWEDVSDDADTCTLVSEDLSPQLPLNSSAPSSNSITMRLVGFLLLLKARHYIPDAGMNSLLKFLHILFRILGRFSPVIANMTSSFPSSLYCLERSIQHSIQFKKLLFVVSVIVCTDLTIASLTLGFTKLANHVFL